MRNVPENVHVNLVIGMAEHIAEVGDVAPGHLDRIFDILWKTAGSFAENLEESFCGQASKPIQGKVILGHSDEKGLDLFNGRENVLETISQCRGQVRRPG